MTLTELKRRLFKAKDRLHNLRQLKAPFEVIEGEKKIISKYEKKIKEAERAWRRINF